MERPLARRFRISTTVVVRAIGIGALAIAVATHARLGVIFLIAAAAAVANAVRDRLDREAARMWASSALVAMAGAVVAFVLHGTIATVLVWGAIAVGSVMSLAAGRDLSAAVSRLRRRRRGGSRQRKPPS